MRLTDVRALLAGHLAGRPTRANFRTGTLTVCTMVPMRSVPHRVVCLVGLDDGVFPRLGLVDGDDVLARDPMTGERDIRSEDRQLLLDAIGAATEKLVITYTGANEHTGQPRPPAVPLGELLDALDRTTPRPGPRPGRRATTRCSRSTSRTSRPASSGCRAALHLRPDRAGSRPRRRPGDRPEPPAFLAAPLPNPRTTATSSLAELLAFFRDPVRASSAPSTSRCPGMSTASTTPCRSRSTRSRHGASATGCSTTCCAACTPTQAARRRVAARHVAAGSARLCARPRRSSTRRSQLAHGGAASTGRSTPTAHDVDVDLGDGRRLTGTVSGVYGDRARLVTYSKLGGKHLLEAWIRLLALTAGRPRPQLDGARDRPGEARGDRRRSGFSGPTDREPRPSCCATWWTSTTRDAGNRSRCR